MSDNPEKALLEKAQRYKGEGYKFFISGKYDEAIAQYNLAIDACPKDNVEELSTFYQYRAGVFEKLNFFTAVRSDCIMALEFNPKNVKALILRARVMESSNELKTALEDITAACILEDNANLSTLFAADKVLKQLAKQQAQEYMAVKKPVMPSKHFIKNYLAAFYGDPILTPFGKALLALQQEDYDNVIPFCNAEVENLAPDDNSLHKMRVLLLRGTFHLLLGQHENATTDLNTVILSDSASKELKVNALIKRANIHMELENTEQSFIDLTEAENLDPDCGDIYQNRGQIHLLMDKVEEAKADFLKAVDLNPDFGVSYVQKCYADYRYAAAKADKNLMNISMTNLDKAVDEFSDCEECYTLYTEILMDTQDFAKADAYLTAASERDPNNTTILVYRGLLQLQWQKDLTKATEFVQKAFQLDKKCKFAYETLGVIEVQRGHLPLAIRLFDKALTLSRTSMELTRILYLRESAKAHLAVNNRLGLDFKPYPIVKY